MAKLIRLTEKEIEEMKRDFEKLLTQEKLLDGKVNFTKSFGNIKRTAKIYFTEVAWLKMQALVREFDKEIAWHGVAKRGKQEDSYIISDILVYPQEVTGATVETDQKAYDKWLMELDDESFNNLRFQGHSHVNMAVSPSSTDTTMYQKFLDGLKDGMFYIFMIWNKKGDKTVKLYDLATNIYFETSDCEIFVEDSIGLDSFVENAKKSVKEKTYSYTTKYGTTGKPSNSYEIYSGSSKSGGSEKKEENEEKINPSAKKKGKMKKKSKYSDMGNYPWDDDDWNFSVWD